MTARIFIDGEAGTTGLGIRQRLAGRADVVLKSLSDADRKSTDAKRALLAEVDLAILCLPDEAAKETAALVAAMPDGPRLLDASTAHRTAPDWAYGFPELAIGQIEAIRAGRRVSNPGCYATGAIALIRPLVDAGWLAPDTPLSINAISGYSGGGKAMIAEHEGGHAPAFELYALGLGHKHVPEIMAHGGLTRRPIFVPSVGHFAQGMLVSIPLHLDTLPRRPSVADLTMALTAHYGAVGPHPRGVGDGRRQAGAGDAQRQRRSRAPRLRRGDKPRPRRARRQARQPRQRCERRRRAEHGDHVGAGARAAERRLKRHRQPRFESRLGIVDAHRAPQAARHDALDELAAEAATLRRCDRRATPLGPGQVETASLVVQAPRDQYLAGLDRERPVFAALIASSCRTRTSPTVTS